MNNNSCPCGNDHTEVERLQNKALENALANGANPVLVESYMQLWDILEFTKMFAPPVKMLLPLLNATKKDE